MNFGSIIVENCSAVTRDAIANDEDIKVLDILGCQLVCTFVSRMLGS